MYLRFSFKNSKQWYQISTNGKNCAITSTVQMKKELTINPIISTHKTQLTTAVKIKGWKGEYEKELRVNKYKLPDT